MLKIVKPESAEQPIPLRQPREHIAATAIRFVVFLAIAIVLLTLIYTR